MDSTSAAPRRYIGIVFKEAPPTADFSRSERIVLPGEHSEQDAWAAVRLALGDPGYVGGEVKPVAEMHAEKDAEIRS